MRVSIARTGYTGEDGFEMFCDAADAPALWDALLEAAAAVGGKPVGLGARDTLRLEARLPLYGNDLDDDTTPLEAGLGWVVKLDAGDFIGSDALRAQAAAGVTRKLVGFVMTGRGIARHGYPIYDAAGDAASARSRRAARRRRWRRTSGWAMSRRGWPSRARSCRSTAAARRSRQK